jgi:hypothetical protein
MSQDDLCSINRQFCRHVSNNLAMTRKRKGDRTEVEIGKDPASHFLIGPLV